MRVLTLSESTFDQTNTFRCDGVRGTCSLRRDYQKKGDGILWIMLHAGCLKDSYTAADSAERERLNASTRVANGETVKVLGRMYRVKINGNYSDAGVLEPVEVRDAQSVLCAAFTSTCMSESFITDSDAALNTGGYCLDAPQYLPSGCQARHDAESKVYVTREVVGVVAPVAPPAAPVAAPAPDVSTISTVSGFESRICPRCGGSGHYSIGVCFKCHGARKVLTKRGTAAALFLSRSREVPAGSLVVGDLLRMEGFTAGSFSVPTYFIKIDSITTEGNGSLTISGSNAKRGGASMGGLLPTSMVRKGWTHDEKVAQRVAALAYQATLGVSGKVLKGRK